MSQMTVFLSHSPQDESFADAFARVAIPRGREQVAPDIDTTTQVLW